MSGDDYFEQHATRRETANATVLVRYDDHDDHVRIEVRPTKARGKYRLDVDSATADALRYALMDELD